MESTTSKNLSVPVAIIIGAIIIALAIIVVRTPYTPKQKTQEAATVTPKDLTGLVDQILTTKNLVHVPAITATDHIRGAKNPKITIIEYSDLECPFCKVFHQTLLKLTDTYSTDVAWVYRHYPLASLHTKAHHEAVATECVAKIAGTEAFWKYTDLLFATTPSNDGLDPAFLTQGAKSIGVAMPAFTDCLTQEATVDAVDSHIAQAKEIGARGTPFSVIIDSAGNTYPIEGSYPYEVLNALIEKLLH